MYILYYIISYHMRLSLYVTLTCAKNASRLHLHFACLDYTLGCAQTAVVEASAGWKGSRTGHSPTQRFFLAWATTWRQVHFIYLHGFHIYYVDRPSRKWWKNSLKFYLLCSINLAGLSRIVIPLLLSLCLFIHSARPPLTFPFDATCDIECASRA